tara:strand:- start:47 stop:577 length:531 start_codon:yes stop_codon:yes gene_type:complete
MAVGNLELVKTVTGTSSATVDVTDCFSADYDVYKVTIYDKEITASAFNQNLRLLDSGGTVISASEYDYAALEEKSYAAFGEFKSISATSFERAIGLGTAGADDSGGVVFYFFNPYDSSSYTFMISQNANFYAGNGLLAYKYIGVHKSTETISGIQLVMAGSTFTTVTASVYGLASN